MDVFAQRDHSISLAVRVLRNFILDDFIGRMPDVFQTGGEKAPGVTVT